MRDEIMRRVQISTERLPIHRRLPALTGSLSTILYDTLNPNKGTWPTAAVTWPQRAHCFCWLMQHKLFVTAACISRLPLTLFVMLPVTCVLQRPKVHNRLNAGIQQDRVNKCINKSAVGPKYSVRCCFFSISSCQTIRICKSISRKLTETQTRYRKCEHF